jgi:hypothetical protein
MRKETSDHHLNVVAEHKREQDALKARHKLELTELEEQHTSERDQVQEKLAEAEDERERVRGELTTTNSELEQVKLKLTEATTANTAAADELQSVRELASNLTLDKSKLECEIADLRARLEDKERRYTNLMSDYTRLQNEATDHIDVIVQNWRLRDENESGKRKPDRLLAEFEALQARLRSPPASTTQPPLELIDDIIRLDLGEDEFPTQFDADLGDDGDEPADDEEDEPMGDGGDDDDDDDEDEPMDDEEDEGVDEGAEEEPDEESAPAASTTAAASASAIIATPSRPKNMPPRRKPKKVYPVPEYDYWLSVDGEYLRFEDLDPVVSNTLKSRFIHEMHNGRSRLAKYGQVMRNPDTYTHDINPRCLRMKCFNGDCPIEDDKTIACRYCTAQQMPCMRIAKDGEGGYAMYVAPLAPHLREEREWDELEYWVLS